MASQGLLHSVLLHNVLNYGKVAPEKILFKFAVIAQFRRMVSNENAKEIRPSHQSMCSLWLAIYLAQEMGAGMGRGQILFRALP
ncbi:MAG: hypothetical protein ACI802_003838 [Candidatus Paceibacteria bacterium]|jgi:hypothetical protein